MAPTGTLPATGLSDVVRNSAPVGVGFLLLGLVALAAAAIVGDRRRREH